MHKWTSAALWTGVLCFTGASAFSHPSIETAKNTQDGVYTQAQAASGRKIYDEKCASCHLETLKGGRNESPALKGDEFLSHWTGKPLRELYSRIISTMPLADPGSLTPKETLDVVAYMLQKNGFRPGKGALQSPNQLNKIQFKTAK